MARSKNTKEMKSFGKLFAERLKVAREQKDLRQSELSNLTGISLDTIRSLEGGRISSPGLYLSYRLVKGVGGNLNKWLGEIEKEQNNGL
jgi:transcriptional regulator with XRE-family HTH domain